MSRNRKLSDLSALGLRAQDLIDDRIVSADGYVWGGISRWVSSSTNLTVVRSASGIYLFRRASTLGETHSFGWSIIQFSRLTTAKGFNPVEVSLCYEISGAAATSATVELKLVTYSSSGATASNYGGTLTYDSGHDTAAERAAIGTHFLTATLGETQYITTEHAALVIDFTVVMPAAGGGWTLDMYGGGIRFEHKYD